MKHPSDRPTCVKQHFEVNRCVAQVGDAGALALAQVEVASAKFSDNVHAVNGSTAPAATTARVRASASSNDGAAVICRILGI